MNRMKILIIGLSAISATSLCLACQAPPPVVPAEKVIALDPVIDQLPAFDVALCDVEAFKIQMEVTRETISYDVIQLSAVGRTAETHAKVSAQGRMCGCLSTGACRSQPSTKYEPRI